MATRKNRIGDDKINTETEFIDSSEEKLWEQNPMEALRYEKIETRKKLNWWARFSLSLIVVLTFLFLVWLLFYTDYWFKDKDDPEQKEGESVSNGNNDTI